MFTNARSLTAVLAAALVVLLAGAAHAQVYKIVDADGNVTYTDKPPVNGSEPMDLPELSVVETEPAEPLPGATEETAGAGDSELTPRELRRMYRDFAITRPAPEETFWGTANQVVIGWSTANPLMADMQVRLYLDDEPQPETRQTMVAMTLDRGAHTVRADLLDPRGRRITSSSPVTFYVRQGSRQINPGGSAAGGAW
ncbi:DUF4124 domain-containing protein [Elongatibacter sediminis]|uniref:DUF4124 domain-containing protein n=1 Tax=Elongatibacter sediminis TaxID=3119006 RepID=A0AAW9RL14_9GAMM